MAWTFQVPEVLQQMGTITFLLESLTNLLSPSALPSCRLLVPATEMYIQCVFCYMDQNKSMDPMHSAWVKIMPLRAHIKPQ